MSDELLVEYRDGIQILTINRPQARNACTKAVAEAMAGALDKLERRGDLRLAILTGAGGTFCAGMDLKGFLKGERPSLPGRGFAGLTEALAGALDLAQRIVANGPLAVAASKRVMKALRDWTQDEMFARQREITEPVFASADAREGAAAFAEKRQARWQGR